MYGGVGAENSSKVGNGEHRAPDAVASDGVGGYNGELIV